MEQPLVSVICLCYNHAAYVADAIKSVSNQTYLNLELIVVDDASSDNSAAIIKSCLSKFKYPFRSVFNTTNTGNCKAFNAGLALAHGKYIIDLAADDLLLPKRIQEGVKQLEKLPESFGIHYCEVAHIDANGKSIEVRTAEKPTNHKGDIYLELIQQYWINPASMMIKKSVLDDLNGYDESLSYEDFDFWVRSARRNQYAYSEEMLVLKRVVPRSLGAQQKFTRNKHESSTFKICQKIKNLNENEVENRALKKRLNYEIKRCLRLAHFELCWKYWKLKNSL